MVARSQSFNPRARAGRDPRRASWPWPCARFNPRARAGRDGAASPWPASTSCFNPRARAGRDVPAVQLVVRHVVSIHAPARGATPDPDLKPSEVNVFQSTRPRGARPAAGGPPADGARVSIHAPARGATGLQRDMFNKLVVSIHAPARGATSHVGPVADLGAVSIHAPARGATCTGRCARRLTRCFNPRARAGRDAAQSGAGSPASSFNPRARAGRDRGKGCARVHQSFQSTRPRGARRGQSLPRDDPRGGFNPRARAGRDQALRHQHARAHPVSIHAPARGATFVFALLV